MADERRRRSREEYARGLPDHHDPTAGLGGAPPARSALTLRLILAVFGLVFCGVAGVLALVADASPWWGVVLLLLAAVAAVDVVVVVQRKRRGEPG